MDSQEVLQRIQEDPTLLQILGAALTNHPPPSHSRAPLIDITLQDQQPDFVLQRQPQFTHAPGQQQLDLLPGPRQRLYHGHSLDWANYPLLDQETIRVLPIPIPEDLNEPSFKFRYACGYGDPKTSGKKVNSEWLSFTVSYDTEKARLWLLLMYNLGFRFILDFLERSWSNCCVDTRD